MSYKELSKSSNKPSQKLDKCFLTHQLHKLASQPASSSTFTKIISITLFYTTLQCELYSVQPSHWPVMEYACSVWQSSLTKYQHKWIEAIQKYALHIISNYNLTLNYQSLGELCHIDTVSFRLDLLTQAFSTKLCQPGDSLYRFLPTECNSENVAKLRHTVKIPGIICRTECFFNSFILHCLNRYQSGLY